METVISVFQSLVLIFLPMAPVNIFPIGGNEVIASWKSPVNSSELSAVIKNSLSGAEVRYHIYIRHLATGESYAVNQNEVISAGSLYKAWLAVGVLDEIRLNRLSEQEELSAPIAELNDWAGIPERDAELTSGIAKYTVLAALKQMISVSHNYSAFLLTRRIGNPKVQKILKKNGLVDMHFVRPPTTSASEMALFLEKVYRGSFFDDLTSQKLRDLLASNNLNDGIPKLLPPGVRVEHKTGELNEFKHDCGIVYSEGGDYIICVMTEAVDPKVAEKKIADISLAVFEYFNKRIH